MQLNSFQQRSEGPADVTLPLGSQRLAGSYPSLDNTFATSCRVVASSDETDEMKMRGFMGRSEVRRFEK